MCAGSEYPRFAGVVSVLENREISPAVFSLTIARNDTAAPAAQVSVPAPVPGQFFMLRARPSGVLLSRPISVYRFSEDTIEFLILSKGRGTEELCALRAGDSLDLVGPIGNHFLSPADAFASVGLESPENPRIAVIGGGIGIAPVAGFALAKDSSLPSGLFDFYASFRSIPYGLDGLNAVAQKIIVTTEDGSAGVQGMLPAVFTAADYDLVYACGPTPMLRWIKEACALGTDGTLAFISMEERMACGAGACLGCTVKTIHGNRRCCVDGPVFNAAEVLL